LQLVSPVLLLMTGSTCSANRLMNLVCCVQTPYPNDGDKQFGLQWWILMFEVSAAIGFS
jgi:hypothetical protein